MAYVFLLVPNHHLLTTIAGCLWRMKFANPELKLTSFLPSIGSLSHRNIKWKNLSIHFSYYIHPNNLTWLFWVSMLDFRGVNIPEGQDPKSKIVLRINVKDFLPTRGAKFGSFDCKGLPGLAGWPVVLIWKPPPFVQYSFFMLQSK